MAFQDSAEVKALSAEWLRMAAAGAPATELQLIRNQAESLRNAAGYSSDASGTIYTALKTVTDKLTGTGAAEVVQQAISPEDTYYVFTDGSGYNPDAYGTSEKIDGENIAGYVVLGLVGLVVLDKMLG